jgi:dipeptidyl aminopeptidase/acylaminoacyl peptidase
MCFSSDRDGQNSIYILNRSDASVRQISDSTYWSFGPCWSSRDLIAYFSKKGGNGINIWTVRPDGSDARQITDQPGESRQPWWSPDGKALAIAADQGTGLFRIWFVRWDGSNARPITKLGDYEQPFWSPDGKRIAVSAKLNRTRYQIYIIESDGSMLGSIRQPEDTDNVHPAWSPGGRTHIRQWARKCALSVRLPMTHKENGMVDVAIVVALIVRFRAWSPCVRLCASTPR